MEGKETTRQRKTKNTTTAGPISHPVFVFFFFGPRNKWAENEKEEVNAAQISCIRARKSGLIPGISTNYVPG